MMPHPPSDGILTARISSAVAGAYVAEPPGWTRLEPQSVSGDPKPGLEARVHDPLWLLARQWQFGEFLGEDAGSPIAVHVQSTAFPIDTWQPGDPAANRPARSWQQGTLLEEAVEREPTPAQALGLRQRADAGAQFLSMLEDAGIAGVRDAILAACPLVPSFGDPFDRSAPGLLALLGSRLPDAEALAEALAAGLAADPPALPAWMPPPPDPAPALQAARDWLDWYHGQVAPRPDPDADCWIDERLEYRFSLGLGDANRRVTLRAAAFEGGRVDWFAFDRDPRSLMPPDGGAFAQPEQRDQTLLATPLRFAGMPASRYWQFEDGQVNLGALEAQPHDLARLLLVEFAIVYGNDWLVVPLDAPLGSLVTVQSVAYRTTFGEQFSVAPADDRGRSGHFRMFEIGLPGSDLITSGLFVPPVGIGTLDGTVLEEVLYLRDETANMAWGVERVVQGPSGDPRSRGDEPRPPRITARQEPGADLDYLLQTRVPRNWIPFLPLAGGLLQKGAMLADDAEVQPIGVLLRPGAPLVVRDEEVPRDGVRVRRRPSLARRVDGTYARWIARRTSVGQGEGASGLAFDTAIERKPPPA